MSRIEKLKKQNPLLDMTIMDILRSVDPSKTSKYMDFLIKQFKKEYTTSSGPELTWELASKLIGLENITSLFDFEDHASSERLKGVDINGVRDYKELQKLTKKINEDLRMKKLEKYVKKIHESKTWLVVIPLSYESSKAYGANTKWCTTQERYWNDYLNTYKLIYIINKKEDRKWAISIDSNRKVDGWLADDSKSNPANFPLPPYLFDALRPEISNYKPTSDIIKESRIKRDKNKTTPW